MAQKEIRIFKDLSQQCQEKFQIDCIAFVIHSLLFIVLSLFFLSNLNFVVKFKNGGACLQDFIKMFLFDANILFFTSSHLYIGGSFNGPVLQPAYCIFTAETARIHVHKRFLCYGHGT